ncbi:MAG: LuxR C-terminal-related transcriptional regulator [bacterium]
MRVLVVAEIRLYRDGLAEALRRLPEVEKAVTAETGHSAVLAARSNRCDVVLLDMSVLDSAATARSLLTSLPSIKILALAVPEHESHMLACAEAGIAGYVAREASITDLVQALCSVLRGEAVCSARFTAGLLRYIAMQANARRACTLPPQLTRREHDVLTLIGGGLSNKEIARSLSIDISTVKNHVHNLLSKLGVACRGDAVLALGGLIDGHQNRAVPGSRPDSERSRASQ